MISGTTRFAVILGDPVRQVKTPAVFNEWAGDQAVDAVMIPLEVPADALPATLTALRGWSNCIGAVVTYPHKQAAALAVDTVTDDVTVTGACNVIRREPDGRLHGGMTDGQGFVAALRANGFDPAGCDARLVGAGGAGSAIALALLDAGARQLAIEDTDTARRGALRGRLAEARPEALLPDAAPGDFTFGLVVNATPVGMNGDPAHPWPLTGLTPGCFVADIVPTPPMTPWLIEAQARGHRVQTGPEMVAGQLPAIIAHLMPEKDSRCD